MVRERTIELRVSIGKKGQLLRAGDCRRETFWYSHIVC